MARTNTTTAVMINRKFILAFEETGISDINLIGGKNASLAEMYNQLSGKGINVPGGFSVTAQCYREFVSYNELMQPLTELMGRLDLEEFSNLEEIGQKARKLIRNAFMPPVVEDEIKKAYRRFCKEEQHSLEVAVRSSATAEDLPTASFAGLHDSYLNIVGEQQLLAACHLCYASLFNDRAIKYRADKGFSLGGIAISVGVQAMVRSDKACSGVAFTIEPESGFENVIVINGSWGLGENIVKGAVSPDEFIVFKPSLSNGKYPIVSKRIGSKTLTMVLGSNSTEVGSTVTNVETPLEKQEQQVLSDDEVTELAHWCLLIEEHYQRPMDIEWAKDGINGEMYIVQARPETVSKQEDPYIRKRYHLKKAGQILAEGSAVGEKIVAGKARVLMSPAEADRLQRGEVLITGITNPDWDPIMKKASAIVTDKGGRTSHASIVARELGIPAIVGTGDVTSNVEDGRLVTVSCAEGKKGFVYDGKAEWNEQQVDLRNIQMPFTKVMMILGDPEKAFQLSFYPNNGVGLLRLEFIIANSIRVHPMALIRLNELDSEARKEVESITRSYDDKKEFFVDKLSQAVATIACAFYPKEVIVRMSDFKSNEYGNLVGGWSFEPVEENPMLGLRGASRYYHEHYREAFRLECAAMKRVRDEMGFTNVKLMIPFCRTPEEGRKVVKVMEESGLRRGVNGLELYVMAEIPSNVLLAEQFAEVFDGFSIGSNDLTQLTLGIDRDSSEVSALFNEMDEAPLKMVASVIAAAKKAGRKIGLCGQAPSDQPSYAEFLVKQGIDSISFTPDALLNGIANINKAEAANG